MLTDYRSNDAVLTICQNNRAELVTITEMNAAAKEILGFDEIDLLGKPLTNILPERISELLKEYIEFDGDNDVGAVLSKVQSFSIIGKNKAEKAYRIKIVRTPSSGHNLLFLLVLQDSIGERKNEAVRKVIRENFKGHEALDPQNDLPDRNSLVKDIGVMKRYRSTNGIDSCFAVVQIDGYYNFLKNNGHKFCNELVKHIASVTVKSLRPDDVVGSVSDGRVGVLLVDVSKGAERLALNRLRWQIASNPYKDDGGNSIGLSVSIGFCIIGDGQTDSEIIRRCEEVLDAAGEKSSNILQEAVF